MTLPSETALFVYNALADRLPAIGEIYDLAAESEQITVFGVYKTYLLDIGEIGYGRIYINAFACAEYETFSMEGFGYLYPGTDGQEGEIQAAGRRHILQDGQPPGLGASLSFRSHLSWQNGLTMDLEAHNLLGWIHFSEMDQMYERVNYDSTAPTPILGHLERGSAWADLPCLVKCIIAYPYWGGEASLTAIRIGKVQDYMLSFAYPWREMELSAGYDPVLDNISLGLSWADVSCRLYFGEEVMGLQFTLAT